MNRVFTNPVFVSASERLADPWLHVRLTSECRNIGSALRQELRKQTSRLVSAHHSVLSGNLKSGGVRGEFACPKVEHANNLFFNIARPPSGIYSLDNKEEWP